MTYKTTVIPSETRDLLNVAGTRVQCYFEGEYCVLDDEISAVIE
ncbi:hypothetical protein [Legionella quateirensis]|nr:hypothetical protein [Legionella quateirensis]